jgi:hypothetical protein
LQVAVGQEETEQVVEEQVGIAQPTEHLVETHLPKVKSL